MSKEEYKIECGDHGWREAAFICQHLTSESKGLGFNIGYDEEFPDKNYPDAWCDECEKAWETEGEWNDKSQEFAQIKAVCCDCYERTRECNWKQDTDAWNMLVRNSCALHVEMQDRFLSKYKIDSHDRWDRDQDTGILVFSDKGKPKIEANFHVAGSLSLRSDTWMWAWANEAFSEPVRIASRRVRELGEKQGFLPLSAHITDASEEDAGHFTAIMAKELNAIGSYRTREDDLFTYMVITKARWVNKKKFFGLFG